MDAIAHARGRASDASEDIMNEPGPGSTFRGLPLTPDQLREVEHYIHVRQRAGEEWDTPDLQAMLDDMLNPPEVTGEDTTGLHSSMASEESVALDEESSEIDLLRSERDRQH
jgi:hypothetical protein